MPVPIPVNIEDEMRQSYMDYAMSVIIGRALPHARDGLKPVHRRVLYAMSELGLDWNRAYKKSARVVGDVIGKYHPHGDSAVYDTIVRLAQDFSMRYPLVDGQGNFGSVDGDSPAAMRYTEIRLSRIAGEMLADIDRDTVDFQPNYDGSESEPKLLPTRLPNLLLNGSTGIAVGMSTNIPPHNLGELVDACIALIENPGFAAEDLLPYVSGPDFPTGGFICGRSAIREAYLRGRGVIKVRARAKVEEYGNRQRIIVEELPYQVNKARLIERMAELVNDKKIEGISDLRDESDRSGMRIVIELKRDADGEVVLNQLYRQTQLQDSFGIILLAIVDGRPQVLDLASALREFLEHRREVVNRRTIFDLRKAEERLHILEGLKIALDNLDAVLALIRASGGPAEARQGLVANFALSETQAQAILDMRLQRLTNLEREKILEEHRETEAVIAGLRKILGDPAEIDAIIRSELGELKQRYGDPRRTEILDAEDDIPDEALIRREDVVVTVSHAGYVKRIPVVEYRAQGRAGRGVIGTKSREEDFVEQLFTASTHDELLFFTSTGRIHRRRVFEIAEGSRQARGKAIVNLLQLGADEKVSAFLPISNFEQGAAVLLATQRGEVKKTDLMAYSSRRAASSGIIAIGLEEGDALIGARLVRPGDEVVLSTSAGQAIRFREADVRSTGRGAGGVRGILLREGDQVVALEVVEPGLSLLAVSETGLGKQSLIEDYRLQSRGGSGIITMRLPAGSAVVGVVGVHEGDEVILVTDRGQVIRIRVDEIRVAGRATQGVRLQKLDEGEWVASVARVVDSDSNNESESDDDGEPGKGPAPSVPPVSSSESESGNGSGLLPPPASSESEP